MTDDLEGYDLPHYSLDKFLMEQGVKAKPKFIGLPIFLYDKKSDDLGIPGEDITVILKVKPENIIAYRKGFNEEKEVSIVYLNEGTNFMVGLTCKQLDKLLNA